MFVINLKRRTDRKEKFQKDFEIYAPKTMKLTFINAVDGTNPEDVYSNKFYKTLSKENDYEGNLRVSATTLSHIKAWEAIANSELEYGLICEDDILFREDSLFRTKWTDISTKLSLFLKSDNSYKIIYFGAGDVLPIHVPMPSLSLLKAVEKSHVKNIKYDYFGEPNMGSSYVFGWLGAFSYILPRDTAKYLINLITSKEGYITRAVDVFLKDLFDKKEKEKENENEKINSVSLSRYMTAPLLTYHSPYNMNIYDSDTWGISIPIFDEKKVFEEYHTNDVSLKFSFIISILNSSDKKNTMERILESLIFKTSDYCDNYKNISKNKNTIKNKTILNFVINGNQEDYNNLKEFMKNLFENDDEYSLYYNSFERDNSHKKPINVIISNEELTQSNKYIFYNKWSKELKDYSDFMCYWNENISMITNGWNLHIYQYNKILVPDKEGFACFQFRTKDTWDFVCPILSKNLLNVIEEPFKAEDAERYIYYVMFLSKICVNIRNVNVGKVGKFSLMGDDTFENNHFIKKNIDKDIQTIVENKHYKNCGVWVNYPKGWKESETVGSSKLCVFNEKTI